MSKRNKPVLTTTDGSFADSAGWGRRSSQKAKRIRSKNRVYFIREGLSGPIKIGLSSQPEKRLVNLQVANPYLLRVLGTVPGSKADENLLHARFEHLHLQGEWYEAEQELLDFIDKLLNS